MEPDCGPIRAGNLEGCFAALSVDSGFHYQARQSRRGEPSLFYSWAPSSLEAVSFTPLLYLLECEVKSLRPARIAVDSGAHGGDRREPRGAPLRVR